MPDGSLSDAWCSGAYSIRQWPGVYGKDGPWMAQPTGCEDAVHREPGSPWENGYIESFNGKLRDELLNREIFDTILEARVLTEIWRREYNHIRPHSSLGYRPPAPEARESLPIMGRSRLLLR